MPSLTKVQTGFLEPQGAFTLASGTASAPGLKFSDSSATGMFSPSTGVLGFSTGSTQNALTILSSGSVGIGTTNPVVEFDVFASSTNQADIRVRNGVSGLNFAAKSDGSTDISNVLDYPITFTTGLTPTEKVRITNAGNVGIGTTNPPLKLTVVGNIKAGYEAATGLVLGLTPVGVPVNDVNAYILWGDNASFGGANGDLIYIPRTSTNAVHRFYTGTTTPLERLRIDSVGNIGLGTTNPIAKLDVRGWTFISSATVDSNWNSQLRIDGNATYDPKIVLASTSGYRWSIRNADPSGNGELRFRYEEGSLDALTISRNGNVGIGTNNPTNKVLIYGSNERMSIFSTTDSSSLTIGQWDSSTNRIESTNRSLLLTTYTGSINLGISGTTNFTVANSGNIGIGITNPSNKLNIVSSAGSGTTVAKFTESTSASDTTSFIAIQTGYPQTSETEGLVRLGVQRNGSGNSASMIFETSTGNSTVRRAIMTNGGFASDFILLSSDNNHQIRSYVDAQKYFDIDGQLGSISYNGTSIGMSSLPGYGVAANLYLGGRQPILPSGWTGTISCIGNANSSSLGTQVLLQTSTDGDTWTTRDQTANTWSVTLTWTQTSAANVPLYVRFRLVQNSGGNVGEGSCRVSDIRITNLYSGPFGFRLSNKLISQYNYQSTTLSSDLTNYQIGLICGSGAFATNNIGHGIAFYSPGVSSSSSGTVVAAINSIDEGSQDAQGLIFCTANSTTGSLSQKLRISNTGNVGIGTTNPIDKLHVQDGRILNFHNVSGTTIHGVVSGYSIGTVATGQTNNANVASNCTYVGFSNDTSTGRTSFRGRFNLTLFGNGTDAAMPVYFTKFGYSGVESGTGGEFHGWIRIATPGSTNPTSYNYSGYNNWANFALQARFDLVHWNAKPHLFAIEYYIPYGRAGIFDIDVSGTQSMFTIWMLPGSYTVEFDACDGLTAHWRNNNNVGGAVDMREASSIVTRSPLAYASRDTRYDSTIMWGSNLVV
jgi:hypothetical protein